jgi:hypothetical protein
VAQARKQGRIPEVKSYDFDGGEIFFGSQTVQLRKLQVFQNLRNTFLEEFHKISPSCLFFTARFTTFWPGDGVVGQLDYFIGKCFDQDADGRLTTGERRRAEKAIPDQKGSSG